MIRWTAGNDLRRLVHDQVPTSNILAVIHVVTFSVTLPRTASVILLFKKYKNTHIIWNPISFTPGGIACASVDFPLGSITLSPRVNDLSLEEYPALIENDPKRIPLSERTAEVALERVCKSLYTIHPVGVL